MNEAAGLWDTLSIQLDRAAAKIDVMLDAELNENAVTGEDAEDWPCWVPTQECLTLNGHDEPLIVTR